MSYSVEINIKLEVKPEDEDGTFTWHEANEILTNGWRLPTKAELNELYRQKDYIGGFASAYYWSSSENSSNIAWSQNFTIGHQTNAGKNHSNFRVRAVRALKEEFFT
jgi:hypothetical protein